MSIEIPRSVTSIGEGAFSGCSSLIHVAMPSAVTAIADGVFHDCRSLTSVEIPCTVTSIGQEAFCGCSSLKSVEIPSAVTSISQQVFAGCCSLTRVMIPAFVSSIGDNAFQGCSSMLSIHIPRSVAVLGEGAFHGCSSLRTVAIPPSVTSIAGGAFYGCTSLASATIPSALATLGGTIFGTFCGAFKDCASLTVLFVRPIQSGNDADANEAAEDQATAATPSTSSAVVDALNGQHQFPLLAKIWATDDIIKDLKGQFDAYKQFTEVPRALRAAPDAKTWAGVQLWLWWLPPTSFSGGSYEATDDRTVCESRQLTIWVTMLAGLRAEKLSTLPRLPEELWLYIFGFLKHDQQPAFPKGCVTSETDVDSLD